MHLERNRVPMKYCDLKERCLGSRAPGKEKREVNYVPNQKLRACVMVHFRKALGGSSLGYLHWEIACP